MGDSKGREHGRKERKVRKKSRAIVKMEGFDM